MRYAHLFNSGSKGMGRYQLVITDSPQPRDGATVHVASKKAAREMAARFNAQPWNF